MAQFKSHLKTFLFAGFPVESSTLSEKKMCLSVAVECRWMHINRGWGGGMGGMRDLGKSIDYLLFFCIWEYARRLVCLNSEPQWLRVSKKNGSWRLVYLNTEPQWLRVSKKNGSWRLVYLNTEPQWLRVSKKNGSCGPCAGSADHGSSKVSKRLERAGLGLGLGLAKRATQQRF